MRLRGISLSTLIMFSLTVNLFSQVSVSDDIYSNGVILDTDTVVKKPESAYYTEILIEENKNAGDDLAEIIGRQPGVIYQKDGATGSRSTVSIRGVDSKKVLVFLDGVPLNSSMGEAVDLSKINPESIEAVEIYKGYIPAKFGGNGFGGVINIRKKSCVEDGKNVELSGVFGSFGEKKFHSTLWYVPHYLIDIYSNLNYSYAENDYPYLDRNHTPSNFDDDTVKIMQNDAFRNFEFQFRPTIALRDNKKLFAEIAFNNIRDEISGNNGKEYKTAELKTSDIASRLVFTSLNSSQNKKGVGELNLGYKNSQSTLFWTALDKSFGIAHGVLDSGWAKMHHNDHQINLNGVMSFSPWEKLNLEGAIISLYQMFLPTNELNRDIVGDWECFRLSSKFALDATYKTDLFNAYLGATIDAVMDSTNGGFDEYLEDTLSSERSYTSDFSWRIGANGYLPGKFINIFASGGRYFKLSSLREKYGFKGGVAPNPDLKNERQYSFDAGIGFSLSRLNGEGTFFYLYTENGIVFISDNVVLRPVNLNYDVMFGGEFAIHWEIYEKLKVNTNFTIQKSELGYPGYEGNMKPYQPAFSMDIESRVGPFYGLSFLWNLEYKSRYFKDLGNGMAVPFDETKAGFGFNHIGLKLIKKRLVLQTYIKNLPLNLFDFDLYGDYALEHLNDKPGSGGGYYWGNHPGIHYHFKVGFSF